MLNNLNEESQLRLFAFMLALCEIAGRQQTVDTDDGKGLVFQHACADEARMVAEQVVEEAKRLEAAGRQETSR